MINPLPPGIERKMQAASDRLACSILEAQEKIAAVQARLAELDGGAAPDELRDALEAGDDRLT